jgi:hypothetical protein
LFVDIAPDGTVYGIEFLNPLEQLGDKLQIETNKEFAVGVKVDPSAFEGEVVVTDEELDEVVTA